MGTTETIRATERSLDILQAVVDSDGASLATLVEQSDLSRYSVYAHLKTLEEYGFVTNDDGVFRAGLGSLNIGGKARSRYAPYLSFRDELDTLADSVEQLVQVAFLEDAQCVYIYQAGQKHSSLSRPRIGSSVSLHASAAGKAILSQRRPDDREELLTEDLPALTDETTTERASILTELETVAEDLIATEFEEQYSGVWCTSTPLRFQEETIGALSVSVPANDVEREWLEGALADEVHRVGRVIEMDDRYKYIH